MGKKFITKTLFLCVLNNFGLMPHLSAQENLYEIVSTTGQTVKYVEYDNVYEYAQGLAAVRLDNHWGYIDAAGNVVIPKDKSFYFDAAESFGKNGLALVWVNGKYKFINISGSDAIPMQFDEAYSFDEQKTTVVKVNDKWGLIDLKGNFLIPAKYEGINRYENLATVYNGEKFALFHTNGQALTDFVYDNMGLQEGLMFENRIAVRQNNSWGFIDGTGKLVIPLEYEEVGRFSEGLVGFTENNKGGYLDKEGKIVVSSIYENIDLFSEGLAAVQKDNMWGYIGKKGEVIIPIMYSSANRFEKGVAYVSKGENSFYIDKTGKQVAEPTFSQTNEVPSLSLKAVEEKRNVSLNYPELQLKVDKFWEANSGLATNGKIYDLKNNELIGEEVIFDKGKIIKGTFYAQGRKLIIANEGGILLADLQKVIAAEASKPVNPPKPLSKQEENERFIKLYEELSALYDKATNEYNTYYQKALEFDLDASNETERKANLYKKIQPFQEIIEAITERANYLLKNDPQMMPETRRVMTESIPKYQAMLDKLRSL